MGGIAAIADDSPQFVASAPASATALNMLRDTALAVAEASRLGGTLFMGSYHHRPEYYRSQITPIWRGGIVYLSSMTTLRVTTHTTGTVRAGDTLRVARGDDDASAINDFTIASGTQTHTVTINTSGYAHEQALRVRCFLIHAVSPVNNPYDGCFVEVVLVEALPVSLSGWPGLPTITTAAQITAANLTAIGDALDWMVRRLALRFDPLFIEINLQKGPYFGRSGSLPDVNLRGGLRRTALHTTLTARGWAKILYAGNTERVRMLINGVEVASAALPSAMGDYSWSLSASLSGYAADSVIRVETQMLREAGLGGAEVNRWTVAEVQALGPSGASSSLAAWDVAQDSVSAAALLAWVQSLITIISAAKARVDANGGLWAYQRAFSARHASNDQQFELFEPWAVPMTWGRAGEALVLRGKGLALGYGAGRLTGEFNDVEAYMFENFKTFTAIDADAVETARIYLDTVPGLPVGDAYNIRGVECYVAFEQLKVVENA